MEPVRLGFRPRLAPRSVALPVVHGSHETKPATAIPLAPSGRYMIAQGNALGIGRRFLPLAPAGQHNHRSNYALSRPVGATN